MSLLKVNNLTDLGDDPVVTDGALVGAGKILQVVSTAKTDTFSTSSTSFTEITGLTASITPSSASSKVLVMVTLQATSNAIATNGAQFRLQRGGTDIALGDASGSRTSVSFGNSMFPYSRQLGSEGVNFLDSPASTSATTYSVEMRMVDSNPGYINRGHGDADEALSPRAVSTITLMEVAG